jgi:hypothetical protein
MWGHRVELQIGSRSCTRRYRIPRNDRSGRDYRMPTLNVLWRLTPARSGAVESLRTPARPHPRLVAPRSPVYEAIEDIQSFTTTLVTAADEEIVDTLMRTRAIIGTSK